MPNRPFDEKRWQMEDDARTLARATEIMADKKRYSGAVKEAAKMAKKADKELKSIRKVAAKKVSRKK